ncbi:Alpha/Beta hydrolase protein [Microdochium trichocladiopsis]|uniref:Alpha/Beta hydrolase protein n=1 Tax=Microdochium trichocladiopsis TaxID=1682393 RepID=A0A9P8Y7M2_9PEZI|nr:Alpha/Beta hydrolase protein [Microdochium trichocladiopsis]KAH7029557.1 Alpha/Beta hydrolase protein [Microdochium trichocladiopsis]
MVGRMSKEPIFEKPRVGPAWSLRTETTKDASLLRNIANALASIVLGLIFFHVVWNPLNRGGHEFVDNNYGVPQTAHSGNGDWANIAPSRKLEWHACFEGEFDCARLDLPMDWLDPSDDLRIILAVIRLRADPDAPGEYLGPVFFNPGGPGGSGVWSIRDHGHLIQSIVGRNHDIVTFDPRGVGASLPRIDCWRHDQKRRLWDLQDVGVPGAHSGIVNDAYVRALAISAVCEQSMQETRLLEHIGTASHARDMLEILDQMGYDKLRYWGFSYGTVLGGYFASMYPDRVERLVSDGNVDYQEWAEDKHINFLRDTDKVMEAFYFYCHQAGPIPCAFYAESPEAIAQRLAQLLQTLRYRPIIVDADPERGPDMPQLVTWSHLKRFITRTMYQPLLMFPVFARILADLERGNGRSFYDTVLADDPESSFCSIDALPPTLPRLEEDNGEAYPAIACADGLPNNDTLEEFVDIVEQYKTISSIAGEVNAVFRLVCVGRKVRPRWRFSGPFGGTTAHPILYVANIADNITPLVSARNNSELFPGSVVLTQNSYGHTTLSAPSACTAAHIRAYFQNGTLPADGEACEPDYHPFEDIPLVDPASQRGRMYRDAREELSAASLGLCRSQWLPKRQGLA